VVVSGDADSGASTPTRAMNIGVSNRMWAELPHNRQPSCGSEREYFISLDVDTFFFLVPKAMQTTSVLARQKKA